MAPLPTAATPGYTTYAGRVSCTCLAEWLGWFERLQLARGRIKYNLDIVQLTGGATASAGTHSQGGVFDIRQTAYGLVMDAREMGAVTWARFWTNNNHSHGVIDCPHNSPAAYQRTACIVYRCDGLGYKGLAGKDPYPVPSKWRTRREGIEWAKAEIARLNASTTTDEEFDVATSEYLSEQIKATAAKVDYVQKQAKAIATQLTGAQAALANAIQALATALGPTVEAAVKEALKDAVVDVNVNFPAEPEA